MCYSAETMGDGEAAAIEADVTNPTAQQTTVKAGVIAATAVNEMRTMSSCADEAGSAAKNLYAGSKRSRTASASANARGAQLRRENAEKLFAAFDVYSNRRLTRNNIQVTAEKHGVYLTGDEISEMLRHWDSSGTASLSFADFEGMCTDVDIL
jgi:hypothetical protein